MTSDFFDQHIRKIDPLGNVTTLAGTGTRGYVDGPAAMAEFSGPGGLAYDPQGNLLIADFNNHRIRKLDLTGNVTTLAGDGLPGYVDGPAASAEIRYPFALTVDSQGNIFVTDNDCHIRKLDTAGNVSTFAGAACGFADGAPGAAMFQNPSGLAVDGSGNLFVADTTNNRIRKIDPSGNVTTLAGNGTAGHADGTGGPNGTAEFYNPYDVVVDAQGNVIVADEANQKIRKIDPNGNVTTLATDVSLSDPRRLALAPGDALWLADSAYLRAIDSSAHVTPIAGNGNNGFADGQGQPDGNAQFSTPVGVVLDAQGDLLVADQQNNRIRKVGTDGIVSTFAGSGAAGDTDGPSSSAQFNSPTGLVMDAQGNIFVGDHGNNTIRKIDPAGNVTTLAGNGTFGFADGQGAAAEFANPNGVAVDTQGDVYVADTDNSAIRKIDPAGNVTTLVQSGPLSYPSGIAIDAQGNLFVANTYDSNIMEIDSGGSVSLLAGADDSTPDLVNGSIGPGGTGLLNWPSGLTVDAQGRVFVADTYNNCIRLITP